MLEQKEAEKKELKRELTMEAVEVLIRDLQNGTFAKKMKQTSVSVIDFTARVCSVQDLFIGRVFVACH